MRTANVKDGFAIRNALTHGYKIAIISGGKNENIRKRYEKLGVEFIYMSAQNKEESQVMLFEDPLHLLDLLLIQLV